MCKKCVLFVFTMLLLGMVLTEAVRAQDPSLVGWWKFDDGAGNTAQDSSGKGHHGTLQGAPQWVAGRFDGALAFTGSNSVQIGYAGDLALNEFTLSAWVNVAVEPGVFGVHGTRSGGEYTFDFKVQAANIHGDIGDGSAWLNTTLDIAATDTGTKGQGGDLEVGTWYAIAYVIDNAKQQVRLYLDGDLKKTISISGKPLLMQSGESMFIGATGYSGEGMNGMIDDVRLYNRALTTAEVKALVPPKLKARKPTPADGATGVATSILQWTPGETAIFVDVYLGTTPDLTAANRIKHQSVAIKMLYVTAPPLEPGKKYYWRVDAMDAKSVLIAAGDVWSFSMAPVTAFVPIPADGAKYQNVDVDLAWTAGQDAFGHEVYFSTNQDDVANRAAAAFQGSLVEAMLELPPLTLETTYYWCVDEIDALGDKQVGAVWSFTTTIPGLGKAKRELWLNGSAGTTVADLTNDSRYPGNPSDVNEMPDFESPASSPNIDNYGGKLSAWLHVPLAGEYTFWIASDDNSQLFLGADADSAEVIASVNGWTNAQEWDKEGSQKSKRVTLEVGRYYLMALWKEGGGGDNCAAAWQGAGIPNRELIAGSYLMPFEALWAYGPRPRNNAVDTTQTLDLKWTAGTKAATHQIYFSEDKDAVANGTQGSAAYRGQQALDSTSFNPGVLEFGKTYYWRVDEVNPAEADSPWKGAVWSFTTANFIVVDDFESYVDDVEGRIFQTWIDGWGYTEPAPGNPGNGTGSTVGYTSAPFAEKTIVKSGVQSMPLGYNNADSPFYSETDRTFDSPVNWTVNGMNTLSLQVRGYPQITSTAVTETGGKMSLTGAGADIWGATDEFTYAYKSLNGDATIVAKVTSVGTGSNTWAKGGVMIRDSLNGNSASAQMALTGSAGNGGTFQNRATAGLDMGANDATSNTTVTAVIAPPYWVKLERVGDTFTGYISPDGSAWTMVSSAEVVMTAPVYIGICVTSHAAGENRTFQFESIKTTGGVTGQWQGAVIDSPLYNSAQDLYVAVADSANKTAVVTNATAVNAADWVEVQMPLSSFTGVNMTKVKKMFIGVGNRTNPMADGTGMLFIDDIRVIKP